MKLKTNVKAGTGALPVFSCKKQGEITKCSVDIRPDIITYKDKILFVK